MMRVLYAYGLRHPLLVVGLLSALSLSVAYIAEYGFHLKPCIMCLYQRIPYAVVVVLSLIGTTVLRHTRYVPFLLLLCGLAFAANIAIAFYHAGMEHHIFRGFASCDGGPLDANTVEELRAQLRGTQAIRCDVPAFVFLGFSMTEWNLLWSAALLAGTLFALRKRGAPTL